MEQLLAKIEELNQNKLSLEKEISLLQLDVLIKMFQENKNLHSIEFYYICHTTSDDELVVKSINDINLDILKNHFCSDVGKKYCEAIILNKLKNLIKSDLTFSEINEIISFVFSIHSDVIFQFVIKADKIITLESTILVKHEMEKQKDG